MDYTPHGIVGITPRAPIGAAITIGIKPQSVGRSPGFPIEKDRFHIVEPRENDQGYKPHHPSFGWYNKADATKRRALDGQIVHATWADCFEQMALAYKLPGVTPPNNKAPMCRGDGVEALRFFGEKGQDDWRKVPCDIETCRYRQKNGRQPPACKPRTGLVFRLDWSRHAIAEHNPPTPTVLYTSGGFNTFKSILGMKAELDSAAKVLGQMLGLDGPMPYTPAGLRFRLTLHQGKGSKSDHRATYWYTQVSLIDSATDHLQRQAEMIAEQRERYQSLPDFRADVKMIGGEE